MSRLSLLIIALLSNAAFGDEPRRVYVPLEDIDVILERDQQGVMLDKVEFEKLTALAEKADSERPKTPGVAAAWTKADYVAKSADDQLLLTVRAELQQFAPGWQRHVVPLPRLSVEQAKLDGEPALVARGENHALVLFTEKAGPHVLELELTTELSAIGADRVAGFGLIPAPTGTLTIDVDAEKRLQAAGRQLPRPKPLAEAAQYKLSVGGQNHLDLRISDRSADQTSDALVFATTGYGLHVMPGEVSWHALTTLQVFGKPLDQLTLSAPKFLEIADVESTGLDAWDLADDPQRADHRQLTLRYRQPFEGERKIHFKGVMATPADAPWSAPALTFANVTSQIGQVVVQYPAGVRLQTVEATGVRRATADQQPASDMPIDLGHLQAVEQWRFDFWQPEFTLRFLTQPRQRDVQTAVAAVLDVNSTGLNLEAAVTVKTRFAPLFDVDLELPADWTLLAAARDGQPLSWQDVSQEAGKHLWRLPLKPPLAVEQLATLQLSLRRDVEGWPVESEPITVELPELVLPQSNLHEGTLVVRGDDEFELAALDVVGLDSVPLKAEFERLRFQSQDTRYSGQLRVTRKPSRVAVESLSFTRLDPQTLHTFLQAFVEVQGGGVRQLRVDLPEALGTSLRFFAPRGPRIVEQTPAAPQNGVRTWTLQFDHRVRGKFLLFVDVEMPRAAAEKWTVPEWTFLDADRQNGFIAIEASGEQRLTIDPRNAKQEALAEVDSLDLPRSLYRPKERIIAVYRTVLPGAVVALSEQRFDKEAVPTAVCRVLSLATVAAQTGELQHRAEFQLNVVGVQSLSLKLPDGAQLWATLVDGKPVEVRQGNGAYLIPLPANPQATQRTLQLFYQSKNEKADQLEQSPPELTVVTGTGTDQPVVVLEQQWKLYHPGETLLVDSRGSLEPTTPLDDTSWLGRWQDRLRRPTVNELGRSLFFALVGLVVVALPILAARRFGAMQLMFGSALVGLLLVVGLMFFTFAAQERSASMQFAGEYVPAAKDAPAMSAPAGAAQPTTVTIQQPLSEVIRVEDMLADESRDGEADSPVERNYRIVQEKRKSDPEKMPAPKPTQDISGFDDVNGEEGGEQRPDKEPKSSGHVRTGVRHRPGVAPPPPVDFVQFNDAALQAAPGEPVASKTPAGLLSLSLELSPPPGSREKVFRYVGQGLDHVAAPLSLTYTDRKAGAAFKVFLIALFALAAWLQRRAPLSWKIAVVVLGIALPLGLVTIAPQSWHVALDGVFFGTLAAVAVWLVEAAIGWCERNCAGCCAPSVAKTAALMVAAMMCGNETRADEAPAAPAAKRGEVIVIPYDDATKPTASERILLSHDKFLELWRKAHPDHTGPAPIDGGLVEALYAAKLETPDNTDDATVRVTARYAIRSYVDGQWSVALPLGAVALSSAKLDGKLAVVTPKDGSYVALIPAAGLHVLDLEFSVPAKLTGAAGQFTLPLKAVPSGKLTFALPVKDLLVRVNGSSSIYRRVTKDDAATIELPVDQAADTTVAWQPPQAKGVGAAVVHVDSATGATIGDAGVAVSAGFHYRVRQGAIQDVRFAFPANLKLQTVTGNDIGGWELQEAPDGRTLRVLFRRPVNDQTQLFVNLFLDQKIGDQPAEFTLPTLAPLEVTNEVGTVAIYAGDQFQVSIGQVTGLTQIDVATFTPAMPVTTSQAPPRAAYRFAKRPFSAAFQVGRQAPQGQLIAQHGVTVLRRKIQSTSRFHYQLTGAPRSALSFTLPKDFLPLEVRATALADWYAEARDDAVLLTVQLAESRIGTVEAVITGSRPRDPNAPAAEILLPQPLDVTRMESTLAVWTDETYLASVQSSDGWRSVDASAAGPALQRLRAAKPIQFAFQSSGTTTKPVTLQLARGEAKLRADTLVTTTVTEFTVVHALALQWQIDGAAVDSLSLTTPKSLSGRLDFQGPELREVTEADAGNDRVRWTIWFRTPVTGKYFATALAALPPASDRVAVPAILCEQPANGQPTVIDNQRQYVLLINGSQSQLSLAVANLVETVQRDDLPIVVPQQQIDQGTELVRLKQLGAAPAWTMQRFAQTESIPASVNFADLTTVIARDGTYRTQAEYTIKNRRRQFLALRLPEHAVLLSVMMQNQPARSVAADIAGKPAHLVALPKTNEADLSFPVKIIVAGKLPRALPAKKSWQSEEIAIPSPEVISQTEDESFGIPVARTRWTVYVADDLDANPLMDAGKHNLTATTEGAGKAAYATSTIQELNELLDVWEIASSSRQRGVAARNNQKQLGIVMHNYSQSVSDATLTPQQRAEIEEQQRKVVERYNRVQQEQLAKEQPSKAIIVDNSKSILNFNDQREALNFAITNNTLTINANGIDGIRTQAEGADQLFQLEVQDQAVPKDGESKEAKPQAQQQSDFKTRGAYQATNEANLGDLNARVSGKKGKAAINQTQRFFEGSQYFETTKGLPGQSQDEVLAVEDLQALPGHVILGLMPDEEMDEFARRDGNIFGHAMPPMGAGGMGGMGGGLLAGGALGGGKLVGDAGGAVDGTSQLAGWTQAGGLSLPIQLPVAGQKLVFTKTGGDAKLALSLRPKAALQFGLGVVWTAIWVTCAVLLAAALRRPDARPAVLRVLAWAALLVGLAGWCLLPAPLSLIALAAFLAGVGTLVWSATKPALA